MLDWTSRYPSGRRNSSAHVAWTSAALASRPRCRSGDCVPLGRPTKRPGFGAIERHEFQIQVAIAMGSVVFVFARYPATRAGTMGGKGRQCTSGARSAPTSSPIKPGCAPWRIYRSDGSDRSLTDFGHAPEKSEQALAHHLATSSLAPERLSITALTATMIEDADIKRADTSGRSAHPHTE
jgi:hypothetical protein